MDTVRRILPALRRRLAALEPTGPSPAQGRVPFGLPAVDGPLGGGLARAALHEVFAAQGPDAPAATGFTLGLALGAAEGGGTVLWVRHEYGRREAGSVHAPGLAEFGGDPDRFILVRAHTALAALSAGTEAARCASAGAVIIELWGGNAVPGLAATRRLSLAAGRSGVPVFLLRAGGTPGASAAETRWTVRAASSAPLGATGAPGHPVFEVSLIRHRSGLSDRSWRLEWNRDEHRFRECPPLPRLVAAIPSDRPAAPADGMLRHAG